MDTNLFVYRFEIRERAKQPVAGRLLVALRASGRGLISTQILSEFANVLLGRRRDQVGADGARRWTAATAGEWPVAVITPDTIDLAFEGVERFGFSWYDAQIWATAKLAGCNTVLSEDFCDGMCADGVRFVNPFAPDFDTNGFIERLSA